VRLRTRFQINSSVVTANWEWIFFGWIPIAYKTGPVDYTLGQTSVRRVRFYLPKTSDVRVSTSFERSLLGGQLVIEMAAANQTGSSYNTHICASRGSNFKSIQVAPFTIQGTMCMISKKFRLAININICSIELK